MHNGYFEVCWGEKGEKDLVQLTLVDLELACTIIPFFPNMLPYHLIALSFYVLSIISKMT
jgi:hypothetical protein